MHDKYPMPSSTAAWFGSGKRMKQEIQQKKVESHNIYTFYLKNEQERGAKRSKNYLIIQNFQYDEWCLSKASKWTTGGGPTIIHLHLNATSRTVLSRSMAAIFMYLRIVGSSAYL
jgi:hypothetical protein